MIIRFGRLEINKRIVISAVGDGKRLRREMRKCRMGM